MKFFLTGATGLIGNALLESLHADGHDVIALSRSARSDKRAGVRWVVTSRKRSFA